MAASTQYGANYAIAKAATPATLLRTAQRGGKLRLQTDVATLSSDSDIGSLVYIGTLPKGAVPIAGLLQGTTSKAVTGSVGWSGDTDALGTFTSLASTAVTQVLTPTVPNVAISKDKEVYITTAGANADSGDKLVTTLIYATAD